MQVGALAFVVHLDGEIRKEERKLRQRSSENPDVLRALARHMDIEAAEATRRKRLVDDANARSQERSCKNKSKMPMRSCGQQSRPLLMPKQCLRRDTPPEPVRSKTLGPTAAVAARLQRSSVANYLKDWHDSDKASAHPRGMISFGLRTHGTHKC